VTGQLFAMTAAIVLHTAAAAQPAPPPTAPRPGAAACQATGCTWWAERPPQFPHPWQQPIPGPPIPPVQPSPPTQPPGLDYGPGYGQGTWLGGGPDAGGVGGRDPAVHPWSGTPGHVPGAMIDPPAPGSAR